MIKENNILFPSKQSLKHRKQKHSSKLQTQKHVSKTQKKTQKQNIGKQLTKLQGKRITKISKAEYSTTILQQRVEEEYSIYAISEIQSYWSMYCRYYEHGTGNMWNEYGTKRILGGMQEEGNNDTKKQYMGGETNTISKDESYYYHYYETLFDRISERLITRQTIQQRFQCIQECTNYMHMLKQQDNLFFV